MKPWLTVKTFSLFGLVPSWQPASLNVFASQVHYCALISWWRLVVVTNLNKISGVKGFRILKIFLLSYLSYLCTQALDSNSECRNCTSAQKDMVMVAWYHPPKSGQVLDLPFVQFWNMSSQYNLSNEVKTIYNLAKLHNLKSCCLPHPYFIYVNVTAAKKNTLLMIDRNRTSS